MPLIETKRGDIYYKDYRKEKTDSPLLLIHGAGGIYLDWPIQLRKTAIVVDLKGHGRSPRPARTRIEDYAADAAALIEALELENLIVAGHSMGGAIALSLVLDYPTVLKALILVGTAASFHVNPALIEGLDSHPEETAKLIVKWEWSKITPDTIKEQSLKRLLETPADVIQGDYIACNAFDVRERLAEIDVPTLVLMGAEDRMIPPEESKLLAEGILKAKSEIVEAGSHMFHLEQGDFVTEKIRAWIASIPSVNN
jgi:pimeloyl-ACP methyl ester carboxylesterase